MIVLLYEGESVATGMTHKAIKDLFLRRDMHRGVIIIVEWTFGDIVFAFFNHR